MKNRTRNPKKLYTGWSFPNGEVTDKVSWAKSKRGLPWECHGCRVRWGCGWEHRNCHYRVRWLGLPRDGGTEPRPPLASTNPKPPYPNLPLCNYQLKCRIFLIRQRDQASKPLFWESRCLWVSANIFPGNLSYISLPVVDVTKGGGFLFLFIF